MPGAREINALGAFVLQVRTCTYAHGPKTSAATVALPADVRGPIEFLSGSEPNALHPTQGLIVRRGVRHCAGRALQTLKGPIAARASSPPGLANRRPPSGGP